MVVVVVALEFCGSDGGCRGTTGSDVVLMMVVKALYCRGSDSGCRDVTGVLWQ